VSALVSKVEKEGQQESVISSVPFPGEDSLASSVVELLERGQSAGQYAQSLRDLLRKMSSNDTTLQLKVKFVLSVLSH
jgi:hypothetical protein